MAVGDVQIALPNGPAPTSKTVIGQTAIRPKAVNATFDGTGAAGPFLPCLVITGREGFEVARVPAPQVAAGASAEVSWFPRVGGAAAVGGGIGLQLNGIPVQFVSENNLNFVDSASVSWAIFDDPINDRYDIEAFASVSIPTPRYVTMVSNSVVIPNATLKPPNYATVSVGSATNDVTGVRQTFSGDATFNGANFQINTATQPNGIQIKRPGIYAANVSFDVQSAAGPLPALFGVEMNMSGVVGTNSMSAMIGNGLTTPSATCTSIHVVTAPMLFFASVLQYSGVTFTDAAIRTQLVRLGDFS